MRSLNDIGDSNAPVGSRDWVVAYNLETQEKLRRAETTVGDFRRSLRQFEQKAYFRILENRRSQPFDSFEEFCAELPPYGLGLSPDKANAIVNEPDSQRGISDLLAAEIMAKTPAAKTRAEAGAMKGKEAVAHVPLLSHLSSGSPERIAARLKRDHPGIAAAVERGEFKSMRQAGIAAGIVKPAKTVVLGDPVKLAKRIAREDVAYAVRVRDALSRLIEGGSVDSKRAFLDGETRP